MRDKLIVELIKELYGPREGPLEEIRGNPFEEYITGVITANKSEKKDLFIGPDSEMISHMGEDSFAEDDQSDEEALLYTPSELNPIIKPKSFGISFMVQGKEPAFKICITWGRYKEKGNIWKREPHFFIKEIKMDESLKKIIIYEEENGKIFVYIRKITQNDLQHNIIVYLLNGLDIKKSKFEKAAKNCIFQPSIRIKMLNETKLIQPEINKNIIHFLYRKKPSLARGFMCSAIWKEIDYFKYLNGKILWPDGHYFSECEEFLECDVRSEFIPLYVDAAPLFVWDKKIQEKFGEPPELSAYKLSEMWEDDVDKFLSPFIKAYKKWIDENEEIIKLLQKEVKEIELYQIIKKQKELLQRLEDGIKLLKEDENARLSFCFANRAIWLQNKWKKGKGDFIWYPFQLAFIIMVLESLSNKDSKFRKKVDLLWIPTGGGKTEAYLAVMLFVMALRRRRAKLDENKSGGGTAVITRYTLRLLTIQQFRRTLRMVTAAEYLRIMKCKGKKQGWRPTKCSINENLIYGSMRFSIGMWVGGMVSPNHLRVDDRGALYILQGNAKEGEPAQVIRCPCCGAFISVPKSGIPAQEKLYLIIRSNEKTQDIKNKILESERIMSSLADVSVREHNSDYQTLILTLGNRKLSEKEVDQLWEEIKEIIDATTLSLRASRPGYFGLAKEPGRAKELPRDFEIYCPNPECKLNNKIDFIEGVPFNLEDNEEKLADNLVKRKMELPFSNSRMPIPAYTVDEQIYHKCPTIIVSTVDKIARLAFEPRAASIFGTVDKYNAYYGYYRNNLLPEKTTKKAADLSNAIEISAFKPPELVIQDELHLIEGPIGSMYGLYENAVEGLIIEAGGYPKYIASTATIKDAEIQTKKLFARDLFQFPPFGVDIGDSFFIRYPEQCKGWDEKEPGRIYMGVYAPGRGPLTPQIRIWTRLLKTCNDNKGNDYIKYFWTLVCYFNAIRELGGGRAIYREDIIERLKKISTDDMRFLDPEKVVELSSRINSTDIPIILDELEAAGEKELNNNPDALFTTSMFGTGVDISHLSLMSVNGQPKTTSQYIQATGRVGRSHGALVIIFLRAGRARDLSHYEMFSSYHHRIHIEIEPSSVSPFSLGCLAKASGPVLVSFLRNLKNTSISWFKPDGGKGILNSNATEDIQKFKNLIKERNKEVIKHIDDVVKYFDSQVDRWENIARRIDDNLFFVEYPYRKPEKNVVLGDALHEKSQLYLVYKNAPQSLREIEETTGFEV